ncbi:hypothetical protein ACWEKT_20365 [Nocardia takedensis]|uniref:hypothetical protein n=1 Tax=Nocardia takedensis TaxID=259390 RepID=UPI0012F658B8|nr:hypothetical protein [Nocardia takedensis]
MIDDPEHLPALGTLRAVAQTLRLDVRDVAYWCGLSMELDETYDPPPESARLSRPQRTLVNDFIRALAETNRHPRPTVTVSGLRRHFPAAEEKNPTA